MTSGWQTKAKGSLVGRGALGAKRIGRVGAAGLDLSPSQLLGEVVGVEMAVDVGGRGRSSRVAGDVDLVGALVDADVVDLHAVILRPSMLYGP